MSPRWRCILRECRPPVPFLAADTEWELTAYCIVMPRSPWAVAIIMRIVVDARYVRASLHLH